MNLIEIAYQPDKIKPALSGFRLLGLTLIRIFRCSVNVDLGTNIVFRFAFRFVKLERLDDSFRVY